MTIDEQTAEVLEILKKQVVHDYAPPFVKRDAHPKMHGLVVADFTVCDDIDGRFQHGVFEQPGRSYKALVRFSNAFQIQHDIEFGTRGMAVKLLGVEGERLSRDETDTQDFLCATWPAFFLPDGTEYAEFATASAADPPTVFNFFRDRGMGRAAYQLFRSSVVMTRSPLGISYFSQTPYKLGLNNQVVKYQLKPRMTPQLTGSLPAAWVFRCQSLVANLKFRLSPLRAQRPANETWCNANIAERDFLRVAMMKFLAEHDAVFDLMVQRRVESSPRMPIEDPTREWPEEESPYRKVATIRIPRQDFWIKELIELGENMSFNPWHALKEHDPLGAINEMRRTIYPAIVKLRRDLNGAPANSAF